jgi:hypothetical protein
MLARKLSIVSRLICRTAQFDLDAVHISLMSSEGNR